MIELLREQAPTARKPHRCSLCTGRIQPGEQYHRDTLVYDGRIYDWLTCQPCRTDDVLGYTDDWADSDDGVGCETAYEWASEHATYGKGDEQRAAKNYLERASAR